MSGKDVSHWGCNTWDHRRVVLTMHNSGVSIGVIARHIGCGDSYCARGMLRQAKRWYKRPGEIQPLPEDGGVPRGEWIDRDLFYT